MKSGTLQHWKRLCLCQHSTKNLQLWPREAHRTSSNAFASHCSNPMCSRSLPTHPYQCTSGKLGCTGNASSTAEQWPGEQGDDTELTRIISSEALQGKGWRPPTEITQQLSPASHDSKLQRIWDKSLELTPLKPRGKKPQKRSLSYYNDTLFDSQQFWYPDLLSIS